MREKQLTFHSSRFASRSEAMAHKLDHDGYKGDENDGQDDQREVTFDNVNVAKEVASESEQSDPG